MSLVLFFLSTWFLQSTKSETQTIKLEKDCSGNLNSIFELFEIVSLFSVWSGVRALYESIKSDMGHKLHICTTTIWVTLKNIIHQTNKFRSCKQAVSLWSSYYPRIFRTIFNCPWPPGEAAAVAVLPTTHFGRRTYSIFMRLASYVWERRLPVPMPLFLECALGLAIKAKVEDDSKHLIVLPQKTAHPLFH